MRHRISGRRLNRTPSHRKAMIRNMVTSLILHEKIKTTDQKAKELRIVAEKLVTLAKRGDLHARRQALRVIRDISAMKKLFDDYAIRFSTRPGGYTRITKIGFRAGDNAKMAIIEYLPLEEKLVEKSAQKSRRRVASKKTPAKSTATKVSTTKEVSADKTVVTDDKNE